MQRSLEQVVAVGDGFCAVESRGSPTTATGDQAAIFDDDSTAFQIRLLDTGDVVKIYCIEDDDGLVLPLNAAL